MIDRQPRTGAPSRGAHCIQRKNPIAEKASPAQLLSRHSAGNVAEDCFQPPPYPPPLAGEGRVGVDVLGNVRSEYRSRKAGCYIDLTAMTAGGLMSDRARHLAGDSARVHGGPGRGVGHQGAKHRMIELMTTAYGTVGTNQRQTRQSKITDRIKRLVTYEF